MSFSDFKVQKQIQDGLKDAGIEHPKEFQEKTISRISGGQTIVGIGPEGTGKSVTLVIGVLMKLRFPEEIAPRALILVPDKEKGLALEEEFLKIGKHTGLRVLTLFTGAGMEGQREALEEGCDIVIGTPDRISLLYNKSAININKLKIVALDDAELIVQKGFQAFIINLYESIPKCQNLVLTTVLHDKLQKLLDFFIVNPTIIEVSGIDDITIETIPKLLYVIPNYKTKLNLLNIVVRDEALTYKSVVLTNTPLTAESIFKSSYKRIGEEAQELPLKHKALIPDKLQEFLQDPSKRILVINGQDFREDLSDVPVIIHFDVPLEKEVTISRIRKQATDNPERLSIIFSTDLELPLVKKVEYAIGETMELVPHPPGLIVEGDRSYEKEKVKEKPADNTGQEKGAAFHEKKESNAKEYNYKYKDRLKMFGKKNRKNKRQP